MHSSHIYIVGAGAIGKTLAVLLTQEGKKVTLVQRGPDQGSQQLKLKLILGNEKSFDAAVPVDTISSGTELDGIIVIAAKAFANADIASMLLPRIGSSPVVILQNGLNVEENYIEAGFKNLYRCVLFATSESIDATTVRYKPVGPSPVGIIEGKGEVLASVVQQLSTELFAFRPETNISTYAWKKTIINSVFNSVCPLLDCDNGIFHRNPAAMQIAKTVIAEGVLVADAEGIKLDQADVENTLLDISLRSDGQLISTLQDIKHGRPTEIDNMNFEIVKIAQRLNKADHVTQTKILGELVKLKEAVVNIKL